MLFETYGPYRLGRNANGLLAATASDRRKFWHSVEEEVPGLSYACGCYIFSIRASRGAKPWYVGKAEKSSFRQECLTAHKINHFNQAIAGRRGYPELTLLAQITPRDKFRKPTNARRASIRELETMLIGMGISRNRDLLNIQKTRMLRELSVRGVLNTDRLATSGPAKALRDLLGQ
ncbi:MAG: hypothetical protein ACX93N_09970 [Pseudohaliea sp.]